MKKLLFILLIIGVLIMLRPINAIIKDNVGNIIHRGFVVTGEVAVDNGDGSYDVYIAGEAKAYPKIFTLARNPDLEVGDTVRILYKNGCKELPIILPPTITAPSIYRGYALIVASPNTLQLFDMEGILLKSISVAGWSYAEAGITMDSNGNIYTKEWDLIKKYDSNLNLLVTQEIESGSNWIEGIYTGNDGYLYSLEGLASGYDIKKRSLSDLTIQGVIPIGIVGSDYYTGWVCLDSSGNFYVYNNDTRYLEKYNNAGAKIAELNIYGAIEPYGGVGIAGNLLYWRQADMYFRYAPLDLSTSTMWDLRPGGMNSSYCLTAVNNFIIFGGWDDDNHGAVAKLDSDRNEIWVKKLDPTSQYSYKAGSYNF